MILVTGATGKLGQLTIQELLKTTKPQEIAAIVRDPAKAKPLAAAGVSVRQADYDRPDSLRAAFKGVGRLLLISSNDVGKREAQHRAVIDAAKATGVRSLAYTSILRADRLTMDLAREHVATEKAILASGLAYTFLRNGWYFENHTEALGPALEHGAILGAAGEGKFSSASRADYAAAAAAVLTRPGHENKVYELAGDRAFTLAEMAAEVTRQFGKPVAYRNLTQEEFAQFLMSVGLPSGFAQILADADAKAATGELFSDSRDLATLIGRPTTSLVDAVKAARG